MKRCQLPLTNIRLILAVVFLVGCGAPTVISEPTPIPPTVTPLPPTPTLTSTSTPTATSTPSPSPTSTLTPLPSPTPIVGITAPLIVNDVGIQIKSALLGADPPIGQEVKPGYKLLSVEVELSGGDDFFELVKKFNVNESKIIDESGDAGGIVFFSIDLSPRPPFKTTLLYAVKEEARTFSLRLPSGQTIDLNPVLKKK